MSQKQKEQELSAPACLTGSAPGLSCAWWGSAEPQEFQHQGLDLEFFAALYCMASLVLEKGSVCPVSQPMSPQSPGQDVRADLPPCLYYLLNCLQ